MTAPAADDARGQLIARLTEAQNQQHTSIPVPDGLYEHEIEDVIDALLPVVSRIADQAAADALREAADELVAWRQMAERHADEWPESDHRRSTALGRGMGYQRSIIRLLARAARLAPPTEPKEQP